MTRFTKTILPLLVFLGSMTYSPCYAVTLSVAPTATTVPIGSQFDVIVSIDGLTGGAVPSLGVFDVDVTFDEARVMFYGSAFGSGLDVLGLGSVRSVSVGTGAVNMFELSLDSPDDLHSLQLGSFELFRLTFIATALGDAPFSLSSNALGDAFGAAIAHSVVGNAVIVVVSEVPEPSSMALLLLGGLAIALRGFVGAPVRERRIRSRLQYRYRSMRLLADSGAL